MYRHLNALKTGIYANTAIFPWESAEAYKKLLESLVDCFRPGDLVEFMHVKDLAENAWRRQRISLKPAVGVPVHPFGRALAQSGAQSIEEFLQKREAAHEDVLKRIADSLCQMTKKVAEWESNSESEDFGALARKILVHYRACRGSLRKIADAFDEGKRLRREFSVENLENLIKTQNGLFSQWDKTRTRLLVQQEARASLTGGVTQPQPNFDAARLLKEMFGELSKTEKQGADDLDGGDEEFESEPRDNINDTAEVDPLEEFISDQEDDDAGNSGRRRRI